MINDAVFSNFKALRAVHVRLAPFTLIIGPNSSGKTSILQGLETVSRVARSPDVSAFGDLATHGTASLSIQLGGEADGDWSLKLSMSAGALGWSASPAFSSGPGSIFPQSLEARLAGSGGQHGRMLRQIADMRVFRLNPSRMSAATAADPSRPVLDEEGACLGGYLADLAVRDPDRFQELRSSIGRVVPAVKKIRLEPTGGSGPTRYQVVVEESPNLVVNAANVGDGTLVTIALLALLQHPARPPVLLVDELERGLHPKALGDLVKQLRNLMAVFGNVQIIATTHSPYLVDHFSPDEIVLTTRADDGSVIVGSLGDHPDFERWKDEMRPGEFWSAVGEDWLRDRPAAAAKGTTGA